MSATTSKSTNENRVSQPRYEKGRYNNPISFTNWKFPTIVGVLKWKLGPTEGEYLGDDEEVG